eukprot:1153431-Pelagomonas_calceolata.AAC.1
MGHSLLAAGHRNGQPGAEVDPKRFAEPSWGENTTPSWDSLREYGIEPSQFGWFHANMRFNSLSATVYSSRRISTQASDLNQP